MDGRERTIAWVGGVYFMEAMRAQGLRLLPVPLRRPEVLDYAEIVARIGCEPDAVVYTDRSFPPPLVGLERFPCLTAFYCIDSHIHEWYRLYARAFDLCAVSLRDHVEDFSRHMGPVRAFWLPAFAADLHRPRPAATEFDLLFVGTVDPATTPGRCDFLRRLGERMPGLAVRRGSFPELLPRARVALNIAERGDLNFRVFEALACGACLLTPAIGNGQDELFVPGRHLATYSPDDADDCADKALALLKDEPLRLRLAAAGRREVEARHRPAHRAETFAARLRQGFDRGLPQARLNRRDPALSASLRLLWLHWAEHAGDAAMSARYLAEARRLAQEARP